MLLKIMDTTDDVKSIKCKKKKKKLWQCNMGDEIKKGKKFNDQKNTLFTIHNVLLVSYNTMLTSCNLLYNINTLVGFRVYY
jgi:hypothetical protein